MFGRSGQNTCAEAHIFFGMNISFINMNPICAGVPVNLRKWLLESSGF